MKQKQKRILPEPHASYFWDGKPVPSVTTIAKWCPTPYLVNWAWRMGKQGKSIETELETAGIIGRLAHFLTFAEITGQKPDLAGFPAKYITLGKRLARNFCELLEGMELVMAEIPLVKPRYGGTPDGIFRKNGRNILVDFKTSKRLYQEHIIQLAAYQHMLSTPHRRLEGKAWVEGEPMVIHGVVLLHSPSTTSAVSELRIDAGALRLALNAFRARLIAYETSKALSGILL